MAKGPHCLDGEQPNKALAALLGAIRDRFGLQHERTAHLPPNVKKWRDALRSYHEALEDAKDDETDTAAIGLQTGILLSPKKSFLTRQRRWLMSS